MVKAVNKINFERCKREVLPTLILDQLKPFDLVLVEHQLLVVCEEDESRLGKPFRCNT